MDVPDFLLMENLQSWLPASLC